MKKVILLLMAISLLAVAVPALADDCNVDFDVNVVKDVFVDKDVNIDKNFKFCVFAFINPKALAECDVWKCDLNAKNSIELFGVVLVDDITGSFTDFTGIGQANQAAGYMNNQGNIVAAAIVNEKEAAAMTEVGVDQENYDNCYTASLTFSNDKITDSFNDFTGIGQANQSAGSMNNQNNVVAISAGLIDSKGGCGANKDDGVGIVATNETFLTQTNTKGGVNVCAVANSNAISGSFNGFTGIGQVNQSAGSLNNQANIVSISYVGPRP